MPKLKDFFKNLNFVSECCNNSTIIDDDSGGDDAALQAYLIRRVEKLESEYEHCVKHQLELRTEITTLLVRLDRARNGNSTTPSTCYTAPLIQNSPSN